MRIVQLTDTHLFATPAGALYGLNTSASLTAVIEHVRAHEPPPDLVLATGDLSHDGSPAAYRAFAAAVADLRAPVYCLPGNHDEASALEAAVAAGSIRFERQIRRDGWSILMLNTLLPGAIHGHLSAGELEHLEAALTRQADAPALICLHHHPTPVGSAWMDALMLDNADAFFAIVDRHPQVRGILWGHVHQVCELRRGDMLLLGSPSTCMQFRPGCAEFTLDDRTPGYRWLDLGADGRITTGAVYLPGK